MLRLAVAVLLIALAACACRRAPNTVFMAGGRSETARSDVPADESTAAMLGAQIWEYETNNEDTYRYRADGWLGGNAISASGQLRGELESGLAAAVAGDHHLFVRGGFAGELQRNAAIGLSLLELPVVGGGYQLHHSSHDTPWHVEVGPRGGLALAGVAVAGDERARLGFAPEVGGAAAVLYNGFGIELSGTHLFETEPMDVFRGSACAGLFLVLCLDHRTVIADFRGSREATHQFALSVGIGWILGEKL